VDAVGRVAKQFGSRGYYATVSVQFSPGGERRVSLDPAAEDAWYRSQGWLTAATDGVSFGLNLAKVCGECVVTRVHGMPCDTSAGLVALASIRAAWAAVSFIPGDAIAVAVESCILRGHRLSPEAVGAELALAARNAEIGDASDGGGR
jgi:hypothetical protein